MNITQTFRGNAEAVNEIKFQVITICSYCLNVIFLAFTIKIYIVRLYEISTANLLIKIFFYANKRIIK